MFENRIRQQNFKKPVGGRTILQNLAGQKLEDADAFRQLMEAAF
jgi:hypothetical protein